MSIDFKAWEEGEVMSDLISRSALTEELEKLRASNPHVDARSRSQHNSEITSCIHRVQIAPTVDAVPKSYADQIRWERDIAIEQLKEIGCSLGQKMDDVKKKLNAVPVVHGEWIYNDFIKEWECSNCHSSISLSDDRNSHPNYCPQCGAKMRGEKPKTYEHLVKIAEFEGLTDEEKENYFFGKKVEE